MSQPSTMPCGLSWPGRVALAPLTNIQSHSDGTLSQHEYDWLVRRAQGGFPWVSTCAAYISAEGKAWDGQLGIAEEAHLPGLIRLASGLRQAGATAFVQLHHAGLHAKLAPDPISPDGAKDSRAATLEDLVRVAGDFADAALRAERAGFDGVEIHGANGYLITEFLAPGYNPRTDAYGGDLTGRARLARETVQAVRASVSPGFAVGIRLSPVDTWERRGLILEDSVQVARWLVEDGIDFLHLSLSDAGGPAPHQPDGPVVATAFREVLAPSVPLLAAGGVWTRAQAERAWAAGVDVVALGKAAIGNPDWPSRCTDPTWAPLEPPFGRDHLRSVAVSERFLSYLDRFPGLVEGGAPPRP